MYKKLFLGVLAIVVSTSFPTLCANAITPDGATDAKYLKDKGHSPEMIRIIELQENRLENSMPAKEENIKNVQNVKDKKSKKKGFIKKLWNFDFMDYDNKFGEREITED